MKKTWRKKNLQKAVLVMMSFVMVFSLVGCGKKKKAETTADLKDYVYRAEDIQFSPEITDITDISIKGDKLYITTQKWEEKRPRAEADDTEATTEAGADDDAETTEAGTDDDAETTEAGTDDDAETTEAGTGDDAASVEVVGKDDVASVEVVGKGDEIEGTTIVKLFMSDLDGSNVTEIPNDSLKLDDETYIQKVVPTEDGKLLFMLATYKNEKQQMEIVKMDTSGKEEWREDITALAGTSGDVYIYNVLEGIDGNLYFPADNKLIVTDAKCKKIFEITSEGWFSGVALTKNGDIVVGTDEEGKAVVKKVDFEKKALGETYDLDLSYFRSSDALISGGEYDFYYTTETAIVGYDIEKKTSTKILDYVASDIVGNEIGKVIPLADGRILNTYYDSSQDYQVKLRAFVKVDPSEVEDKVILTFAGMYISDDVNKAIINFNKTSTDYKIVVKDYSNEEDPTTKLNTDIIAGDIPDIFSIGNLPIDQYIAKGVLEDMTPYLEKDSELSKEDFVESVYEAMCEDGKLYFFSPNFYVSSLVGSVKDVGTETGWTFDEMMTALEKKGPDALLFSYGDTKEAMFGNFITPLMTDYVDWQTGTCRFEGEEFIKILEYCNQFRDGEVDYENMPQAPQLVKEGKLMLNYASITLDDIQLFKKMYGGDINFIGYPNAERRGNAFNFWEGMAISSKSEHKDAAWEFVRQSMKKEYFGQKYMYDMSTRKDALEEYIKYHTTTEPYKDEFGNEVMPYDSSWGWDDLEVKIGPSPQEDVDLFRKALDAVKGRTYYDNALNEMIMEEVKPYFAGEKSAQETAKIIQNRVTTYVNENR